MLVAALALASGTLAGSTATAAAGSPRLVSITVLAIDRSGDVVHLLPYPIAAALDRTAPNREYIADASGVFQVPAGRYMIGAAIRTPASGSQPESFTLAARLVRVAGPAQTITLDARAGVPVDVLLTAPGAQLEDTGGTICVPPDKYLGHYGVALAEASAASGALLYAVPAASSNLRFAYGAAWRGADNSSYLMGGSVAGIPGQAMFTFGASDFAALTLDAASGASAGSAGSLAVGSGSLSGCPSGAAGAATGQLPVHSQATWRVSTGPWRAQYSPNDYSDDTSALAVSVRVGHSYTRTFGAAVRGPVSQVLPHFEAALGRGEFWFSLIELYSDTGPGANGAECCASGVIRLTSGSHRLRATRFANNNQQAVFRTALRKPGWYDLTLKSSRNPAPPGVLAATMSTKVNLSWRFEATAADLSDTFIGVPVSVTLFRPSGLDLSNNAPPGSATPVHLVISRGRAGPGYRLKSVRLLMSFNGGSWQRVQVTGSGDNWLAEVPAPGPGFMSLRSIVTDVRGDTTVETIYQAYGIA